MSDTKTAAHTPGPWEVGKTVHENDMEGYLRIDSPSEEVFGLAFIPDGAMGEEAETNAHLIAAAPGMLVALKSYLAYHNSMIDLGGAKEPFDKQMIHILAEMQGEVVAKIQDAIAKAEARA